MPQTIAKPVEKGWTADNQLERMLAYNVYDSQDNRIGHVSGLWVDSNNQVEFVGVKTSWLVGRTHIFPAERMQVNHAREIIRAPYAEEVIKDAPAFDPGAELIEAEQREVFDYYQRFGLQRSGARGATAAQPQQRTEGREETTIPLTQEQLKVGKRQVEAGGVRLRKIVRTETVNQPVELKREEVVIERVPGQAGAAAGGKQFQQEDIYIPLRREEAVVQKEGVVREQVRVRKTAETEQKNISEQVRKEDVEIEESGDASRLHTEGAKAANRLREQQEQPRSKRQGS
ncbi:MAG TPA: PRC and DUF2382 domain-containing protein [Verrucomicrobiae bacterium]|nr:PRC and DUF2382 domain-containing protein [Verrucomicrobiae bacterium]